MTEREFYIWISGVSGWTWRRHEKLMEFYGGWRALDQNWRADRGRIEAALTPGVYAAADAARDGRAIAARLSALAAAKVGTLTPADALFPDAIRHMGYDVPFLLTYAGDPALLGGRNLAVVGSRRSSAYGARITERLVRELGAAGLGIVSGLAYGIDSHAHRAALAVGAPTIAVLGSGLRRVTPPAHTELARDIVRAGGLVLSEFEPDFGGSNYSYPQRNRLIAALAEGVLLTEAGDRSGALYTVDHAVEQGKDVFLVPGELDAPQFAGIRAAYWAGKGNFIYSADEILSALGLERRPEQPAGQPIALDPNSRKILDSLSAGELNYDSLFERAGLSHSELGACLTRLEMYGLIGSHGNLYYKTGEQD